VEEIARIKLERKYNLFAPKGVNGRNNDNTLIQKKFQLGAFNLIAGGNGTNLPVDLRSNGRQRAGPECSLMI
jgi:hypothetical protein